jgi:predicted DNA-binding protein (UPF0251 family)
MPKMMNKEKSGIAAAPLGRPGGERFYFLKSFINKFKYMTRPRLRRRIRFNPKIKFYKPQGIPMRALEIISLTAEELEAMRLKNLLGLEQIICAEKMNTSQSTFQRILSSAYLKVSEALVKGKAIKINTK